MPKSQPRHLPAGVVWVALAQLAREAVGFLGVAGVAERHCGFVERARRDEGIVVKQSDAFECFAGVIEISALQLNFACEPTGVASSK
jgi:hypothetical protein